MKKINTIFDVRNTFRVKNLDETIKKLTEELVCLGSLRICEMLKDLKKGNFSNQNLF